MTRAEFIREVTTRLGYPGMVQHDLYRRVESMFLQGWTVDQSVAHILSERKDPAGVDEAG